ncbi:MAG TPA: hypothetical protein VNY30_02630 [Bryobacteraceae bacterium]|nr:hypothetical protein [Bryobacteraceae bacterium]
MKLANTLDGPKFGISGTGLEDLRKNDGGGDPYNHQENARHRSCDCDNHDSRNARWRRITLDNCSTAIRTEANARFDRVAAR